MYFVFKTFEKIIIKVEIIKDTKTKKINPLFSLFKKNKKNKKISINKNAFLSPVMKIVIKKNKNNKKFKNLLK